MKPVGFLLSVLAISGMAEMPDRAAHAQEFPSKIVRIVVPTAPGGTVDFVARLLAQKLTDSWGQGVIVDNRAGAGGVIGAEIVAKATPDGYTVALVTVSFTTGASISNKLPYDALRDFAPVTLVAFSPYILVVNPSLPVRSVKELVALAKEKPGEINYASAGIGGSLHLATELLNRLAGINLAHVPYKGTVPAVNDVIGGQVQVTITGVVAGLPLITAGKLRLLAVTGTTRSSILPEIPTIRETVPGYEFNNWFGILAPRSTSNDIVAQWHANLVRALQSKEIRQLMLAQGVEPAALSSVQLGDMIRQEINKYTKLVKDIGIRVD